MEYKIEIDNFEGPLDLLLHLIKESNINITDISIEAITKQYLNYINLMEQLNLNIASEYLSMAAELIEIKSSSLLPKKKIDEDLYEEDPREKLINKLLEYQKYKEVTTVLKEFEINRKDYYFKEPEDLSMFQEINNRVEEVFNIEDLVNAINGFLEKKELNKPLNTKITNKEYSVGERSNQIKNILKDKKRVEFEELFDIRTKDYIVVTFLSILELAKKQEIAINQDTNFNKIYLEGK